MKPALAVLVALVAGPLLGALVSPHVFNGLVLSGRHVELLEGLRDVDFVRVTSRCVMVTTLLLLLPLMRWSGMAHREALGLAGMRGAPGELVRGWLYGVASLLLITLPGWALGAYAPVAGAASRVAGVFFTSLWIGLVIGGVEEFFFRGVVYGALRRGVGFFLAAVLSSAFYAVVHFMKPAPPMGIVHADSLAGFGLARDLFHAFGPPGEMGPFVFTLFFAGLVLCRIVQKRQTLYMAIGLHAGWVCVIQTGAGILRRRAGVHDLLFGNSVLAAKSVWACGMALVCLVVVLLATRKERAV